MKRGPLTPLLLRLPAGVEAPSGAARSVDLAVHGLSLLAGLVACLVLGMEAARHADIRPVLALGSYGFGLAATLLASALYHLARPGPARGVLRRLDHAAIYLMIAGTYAPVCLLGLGGPWGSVLLAVVGVVALAGIVQALMGGRRVAASVAGYLVLGWLGVAALPALLATLQAGELVLLGAGGVLYSLGTAVLLRPRWRFHNAGWHALVLAAAGCHFALVLQLAMRWPTG